MVLWCEKACVSVCAAVCVLCVSALDAEVSSSAFYAASVAEWCNEGFCISDTAHFLVSGDKFTQNVFVLNALACPACLVAAYSLVARDLTSD